MTDNVIIANVKRFTRQKRHAQAAANMLEKRQGRSTTTARGRATETEVTVTRVRATTRPTVVDDDEEETTTARGRGRTTAAPAPPAAAPAPVPVTSARVISSAIPVVATTSQAITPVPFAPSSTSTVFASGAAIGEANGTNTTASKGGLSQGATIGIAIGAGIVGLLLLGFIGSTLYRRKKRQAANGDYSWSSKEKEDLFGPSPSRNVMSDASFGNTAPSKYRPLSGEESRKMLLGAGAGAMAGKTHNTTSFSEAMFSQPKPSTNYSAPRASFMTGPQGPPPSVGALYGQNAPPPLPTNATSPFDDAAQYQGKLFVVRRTFEPSLADELIIYPGDRIEIITSYDDGWCLGINLDSAKPGQEPQKGVFPRDCVEEIGSQDVPLASGQSGLQRAPTLPPMSFDGNANGPPAISVSSPGSVGRRMDDGAHAHHTSNSGSQILSRFPDTPAHRDSLASPRVKRTSSLIAGKDAELYRALGDAIDGRRVL